MVRRKFNELGKRGMDIAYMNDSYETFIGMDIAYLLMIHIKDSLAWFVLKLGIFCRVYIAQ